MIGGHPLLIPGCPCCGGCPAEVELQWEVRGVHQDLVSPPTLELLTPTCAGTTPSGPQVLGTYPHNTEVEFTAQETTTVDGIGPASFVEWRIMYGWKRYPDPEFLVYRPGPTRTETTCEAGDIDESWKQCKIIATAMYEPAIVPDYAGRCGGSQSFDGRLLYTMARPEGVTPYFNQQHGFLEYGFYKFPENGGPQTIQVFPQISGVEVNIGGNPWGRIDVAQTRAELRENLWQSEDGRWMCADGGFLSYPVSVDPLGRGFGATPTVGWPDNDPSLYVTVCELGVGILVTPDNGSPFYSGVLGELYCVT